MKSHLKFGNSFLKAKRISIWSGRVNGRETRLLIKKLETKRQHKKHEMEETWKHGFTIWEKKRLETKQDIEEENWYV